MNKQIAALAADEKNMVMWDIDSVLEEVKDIPAVCVETGSLVPREWLSIDRSYAMTTDCLAPLLLFELPHTKAYIADGNHRLYRACEEGIQYMNVIPVPESIHLKYLYRCSRTDYLNVVSGLVDEGIFIDSPVRFDKGEKDHERD